jgi:hypothetical protein
MGSIVSACFQERKSKKLNEKTKAIIDKEIGQHFNSRININKRDKYTLKYKGNCQLTNSHRGSRQEKEGIFCHW